MLRWNGHSWRRVHVPDVNRISYLSFAGRSSGWATGDCGLLHWNGRAWRAVAYARPATALQPQPGDVAAVTPGDACLLGSTYDSATQNQGGFADHWNGRRWERAALPRVGANYTLDGVDARGRRDVWIAGTDYPAAAGPAKVILLHWNGTSWRSLRAPAGLGPTVAIDAVRILAAGDVWVVGWDKTAPAEDQPRHPVALHWRRCTGTERLDDDAHASGPRRAA